MNKQEITFDIKEPKKHSVCYKTKQPDAPVQSVYIMRAAMGGTEPAKIKMTIEEA